MSDNGTVLEESILNLLWKWKVLGTMSISMHITGKPKSEFPYRKLLTMQEQGLVCQIVDSYGKRTMWSLTRPGFVKISQRLPRLREYGYKSEYPMHDFICSALHSAGPLCLPNQAMETFSEQELRRYHVSSYLSWVPQDDGHRPDGYWCIPRDRKLRLLALEVELHHQTHDKYRMIGEFYHRNEQIEEVIWIFRNLPDAMGCLQAINKFLEMDAMYHRFITLDQLIELGWTAPTYFVHRGGIKRYQPLIRCLSGETPNSELRHFLNMRKCHYYSKSYLYPY